MRREEATLPAQIEALQAQLQADMDRVTQREGGARFARSARTELHAWPASSSLIPKGSCTPADSLDSELSAARAGPIVQSCAGCRAASRRLSMKGIVTEPHACCICGTTNTGPHPWMHTTMPECLPQSALEAR